MCLLLEIPFTVVKWTNLPGFQPSRDAVEMERMLKIKLHDY